MSDSIAAFSNLSQQGMQSANLRLTPSNLVPGENPQIEAERIQACAQEKISKTLTFDIPGFVDALFPIASRLGTLQCSCLHEKCLRFCDQDTVLCDVMTARARDKLRMICARLGVVCRERTGADLSLYGDHAEFVDPLSLIKWKVEFENTMHRQEFRLSAACPAPANPC